MSEYGISNGYHTGCRGNKFTSYIKLCRGAWKFDIHGRYRTSYASICKKASVPVCVHLDHGESIESCIKAIQLGFSSVMIDASGSDYEENIRITAEVVRLAHAVDVTVEAELGHIFSSDKGLGDTEEIETADSFSNLDDVYTSPDMAKDFVEKPEWMCWQLLSEQVMGFIHRSQFWI